MKVLMVHVDEATDVGQECSKGKPVVSAYSGGKKAEVHVCVRRSRYSYTIEIYDSVEIII